ncbi:hypothetical protein FRC17_003599 [Serendipita sp. 399]|nr:hypothetical protein FRC17_003599 [Serendipita sp. 399]
MVELGWTRPRRFDLIHESAPLVRSIARYHAFLDLMAQYSNTFFVPTLDIDLAWHTHQLKSFHYRDDTLRFLGRFPNHDDSVDQLCLSKGYDITAQEWKRRFGVPYSVCGCVPDPDQESRMSRFASKIATIGRSKSSERVGGRGGAHPQVPNPRPDLVSTEEDEADSSHPSEHNLQFGNGNPRDWKVTGSVQLREKHTAKCVASAKKAATRDPWRGLQAERNENRRSRGHKEAFTDPHSGSGQYYAYWGVSAAIPLG